VYCDAFVEYSVASDFEASNTFVNSMCSDSYPGRDPSDRSVDHRAEPECSRTLLVGFGEVSLEPLSVLGHQASHAIVRWQVIPKVDSFDGDVVSERRRRERFDRVPLLMKEFSKRVLQGLEDCWNRADLDRFRSSRDQIAPAEERKTYVAACRTR
jgi:hypothetical protein